MNFIEKLFGLENNEEKKEQVSSWPAADLLMKNCQKAVDEAAPILRRSGYFKDYKMYCHPWGFTHHEMSDIIDFEFVYDDKYRCCVVGIQYVITEGVRRRLEFFRLGAVKKEIEETLKMHEIKF